MLLELLKGGKTITGAVVLGVVTVLNLLGVQTSETEVAGGVGAAITLVGLFHKIIKSRKKEPK
jgi:hypothetical protein